MYLGNNLYSKVNLSDMRKKLEELYPMIPKKTFDTLCEILLRTNRELEAITSKNHKKIIYPAFNQVMKIWSAFLATDINNDCVLNKKEL